MTYLCCSSDGPHNENPLLSRGEEDEKFEMVNNVNEFMFRGERVSHTHTWVSTAIQAFFAELSKNKSLLLFFSSRYHCYLPNNSTNFEKKNELSEIVCQPKQ